MTKEEFLKKLQEAIGTTVVLSAETELAALPEWDSLGVVSTISMIENEFKISLNYAEMDKMKYVKDLIEKLDIQ